MALWPIGGYLLTARCVVVVLDDGILGCDGQGLEQSGQAVHGSAVIICSVLWWRTRESFYCCDIYICLSQMGSICYDIRSDKNGIADCIILESGAKFMFLKICKKLLRYVKKNQDCILIYFNNKYYNTNLIALRTQHKHLCYADKR